MDDGFDKMGKAVGDKMDDGFDKMGKAVGCLDSKFEAEAARSQQRWNQQKAWRRQDLLREAAALEEDDEAQESNRANVRVAVEAAADRVIANNGSAAAANAEVNELKAQLEKTKSENAALKRKGREGIASAAHVERLAPTSGNRNTRPRGS